MTCSKFECILKGDLVITTPELLKAFIEKMRNCAGCGHHYRSQYTWCDGMGTSGTGPGKTHLVEEIKHHGLEISPEDEQFLLN